MRIADWKIKKTFDPVDWSKLFKKYLISDGSLVFFFNLWRKKIEFDRLYVFKMAFLIEVFNWLQYHITNVTFVCVKQWKIFMFSLAIFRT